MPDEIELRGAGNHAVIGRVPSWLAKWGNVVILLVLVLLLYISFRFTFPVMEQGSVHVTNDSVYIVIPQAKLNRIARGQDVGLRMDNYPYMDYGILQGTVSQDSFILRENTALIPVVLRDGRNHVKQRDLLPGMTGTGDIIVEKAPLIYRIIKTR